MENRPDFKMYFLRKWGVIPMLVYLMFVKTNAASSYAYLGSASCIITRFYFPLCPKNDSEGCIPVPGKRSERLNFGDTVDGSEIRQTHKFR